MSNGKPGALVISLDLEFYWGVRDVVAPGSPYWSNLLGERAAIKAILDLFEEYEIAATWATVGFLFAQSAEDAKRLFPSLKPAYAEQELSPYSAFDDPSRPDDILLFGPDVLDMIAGTPCQEIATHTFSHYYCCEPGQDREAFAADLDSALQAAAERDISIRSIVFPRNQHNPEYDDVLAEKGIVCYRGNQAARIYQMREGRSDTSLNRISRLADSHLNFTGSNTYGWDKLWNGKLANVPASLFLRSASSESGFLQKMRYRRIAGALGAAAERGEVFHLWWHPHNFGVRLEENIGYLRSIFEHFSRLRDRKGMRSFSMIDAAEFARASSTVSAV